MEKKDTENNSTKAECPECGKDGNCVRLEERYSIFFANIRYVWHKCTRCGNIFLEEVSIG